MSNLNTLDTNFMNNMMNDNFINMAKTIDLDGMNGTNIMDLNKENFNTTQNIPTMPTFNMSPNIPNFNMPSNMSFNNFSNNNMQNIEPMQQFNHLNTLNNHDPQMIKSITKEIINNLKENNISLHDENTTYYSKKNMNNINSSDIKEKYDDFGDIEKPKKSKKSNRYKDEIKRGVEHMLSENGIPQSENVSSYIFDDLFNLKDAVILFGVYFLLSQEMIKDLFSQYFTSLEPDDTGKIHVKGVIIYGLILTILFMALRKLL